MRGEYWAVATYQPTQGELPPRARRIPASSKANDSTGGTTSACAENTDHDSVGLFQQRNYLRVRGEYISPLDATGIFGELPPRARRIRVDAGWISDDGGTTSACAENTSHQQSAPALPRNYLRVRGEYNLPSAPIEHPWELPPRARRIHSRGGMARVGHGTTSACAENTFPLGFGLPSARNYLRVRGEYPPDTAPDTNYPELPPRARRIPVADDALVPANGTTSACAENTMWWRSRSRGSGNYLRVRGEYSKPPSTLIASIELPPRARRIHEALAPYACVSGTTSACAENTGQTARSVSG